MPHNCKKAEKEINVAESAYCRDEVQKRNMKRPKGHLMNKETIKNTEMPETIPSPKFGKI